MNSSFGSTGGEWLFRGMPAFIVIIFVVIIGTILFAVIRGVGEWSRNNSMPVRTEHARLVSKRTNVSHSMDPDGTGPMTSSTSTSYYVTYQIGSGERMEFAVRGNEYGMLAQGDEGELTYQGTRYHGFRRYP
ncbi:DUF2500 domain-containing protein [Gorillibacterium sp. sgz500922]|uniref:DUF2500 domain-containing protein n=1 Tax=Gorillibacterium sp. sgz500922 TaxID=3446694 RepID=UPI003F66A5C2